MIEKLLGIVTRSYDITDQGIKDFLTPPILSKRDVLLVFTTRRILVLEAATVKGIGISSFFGFLGTLWAIKELREQDKMIEASIGKLEEKMKYDIPLNNVVDIEVNGFLGGIETKIVTKAGVFKYRALEDKKEVSKLVSEFLSVRAS